MIQNRGLNNPDRKRRRRERYLIIALAVAVVLLTYVARNVYDLGLNLPIPNSILIFALININLILLLLLIFLTTRNLVKLLFERRKGIMGSRLRTKLVLAFLSLSFLPTVILFVISVQFISSSIEYWFNLPIERSLKMSLEVGQDYYQQTSERVLVHGNNMGRLITYHGYMLVSRKDEIEKFIDEKRLEYRLSAIKVFSHKLQLRARCRDERTDLTPFKDPGMDTLREALETGSDVQDLQVSSYGVLVQGIVPIFSRTESKAVVGLLVLEKFIPRTFVNKLNTISKGLEEYKQFKMLKTPVKVTHLILLSIVTLLIIFSSVWFGFSLSKGITVPIQELAEGTNRIASGDYDFFIDLESQDEIGILVNSFNRMTLDLKNSKKQLEEANEELIRSNIEAEQRRLYMEIVLANVAAGVVSADAQGNIQTINKSAARMLDIQPEALIGRNYKDTIRDNQVDILNGFLKDGRLFRKGSLERQIHLTIGDRTLALLVSLNILRDDQGNYLGLVAVFEDLTEIEKAHRMAAWREVARRIAHEVKNPLTPIQLSAQRLKRRYGDKLDGEDVRVFEECTDMIVNQVEELKRLVNEFSSFARMPALRRTPNNANDLIKEAVSLYKDIQKGITIRFREAPAIPPVNLDREQMKRVMINLLDNALDAIDGRGRITIDLSYDREQERLLLEVSDDGRGIPAENKGRLFEPYFSTKRHGTGLGLTIINTIINDHGGTIRVQDNQPRGTRVIIGLPVNSG